MRIDAHHHLWTYDRQAFGWIDPNAAIAHDYDTDDLTAALAERQIDAAIAVQARQTPLETQALLAAAADCPGIIAVVGWIDLKAPDVAEHIDAERTPRLVGYRHVVQDEPDAEFLLDADFIRGVRAVAAAGLSYDLLVDHRQLAHVPAFLDRVGEGQFILDHAAKPSIAAGGWQPWADRLAAAAACPDLYCKVSGLVTEADHRNWRADQVERYLDHVFALFGPDRLIWGSDWPVCLLAAGYGAVYDLVADYVARHCPDQAAAIFGGNALSAYAIGEVAP
ncbi:amidohydrolase family protein [Sphingomonas sp. Y38-1Y]|uniref:amidohydrolase family protein n=1 Tax=Sphingomonas sp. Y38-1Y TaxID=3078265 RepID=UPI0028EEFAD1|nr:amidohydrolase family protein [Sphingomonas sp. Y38-1Y]